MKIVTGYKGTPHISSQDQQGFNYGITGMTNCVFNVGNRFGTTYANETLTIKDGEGVMQGVHFRIPYGETDSLTFSPTSSGYTRIDLVCARYTKAAGTGIESVDWYVHQGTPSTGTPSAPSATSGNIPAGATVADFAMWKVTVNSSGIASVAKQFSWGCTPLTIKYPEQTLTQLVTTFNLGSLTAGTYLLTGTVTFKQTSGTAGAVAGYGFVDMDYPEAIRANGSVYLKSLNTDYYAPISDVIRIESTKTLTMVANSPSTSVTISFGATVNILKLA